MKTTVHIFLFALPVGAGKFIWVDTPVNKFIQFNVYLN